MSKCDYLDINECVDLQHKHLVNPQGAAVSFVAITLLHPIPASYAGILIYARALNEVKMILDLHES